MNFSSLFYVALWILPFRSYFLMIWSLNATQTQMSKTTLFYGHFKSHYNSIFFLNWNPYNSFNYFIHSSCFYLLVSLILYISLYCLIFLSYATTTHPSIQATKYQFTLRRTKKYSYRPPSSSSSKSNYPRGYDDKVAGVHSGLWGRKEEKPME